MDKNKRSMVACYLSSDDFELLAKNRLKPKAIIDYVLLNYSDDDILSTPIPDNTVINVHLDQDAVARFDAMKKKSCRTKSIVLYQCIKLYIDKHLSK